jgi:signal transduction histidine kinase
MVHELLDLSSIDCARLEVVREPTDLETLLVDVLDRVVSSRDRANIEIEVKSRAMAMVDVQRIERVVANLVQNALKYAPDQPVLVRLETTGERACVSVIDSGPGLGPDEIDSLFSKHRRCRTAGRRDGSGLGLYVSRKIVEAHDGFIGVETNSGGSRFYFEIPLYRV